MKITYKYLAVPSGAIVDLSLPIKFTNLNFNTRHGAGKYASLAL